jgi:hypothetical protein
MTVADAPDTKANDNVLDFTLAHFSPTTEEELYEAVRSATAADLEKFLDAYGAFAATATTRAPLLRAGELRPYFPAGDMPDWMQGRFSINNYALTQEGGDWKAVDVVKHRLLYCHSVAFDDPMPDVVSLAMVQLRIPQPWHNGLLNYINLLLHFRDLIRRHVVCPVSHESYLPGHIRPDYVALGDQIGATADRTNPPDIDELFDAAPPDVQAIWRADLNHESGGKLAKTASVIKSCERISQALAGVKNAPGRLSLYFPFRYDVNLLERCGPPDSLREFGDRDNRNLNELVDLEMPNLESLDPAEIVAIRSGDEFERWRRILKGALADAGNQPADLRNKPQEVRNVIDEKLIDGKNALDEAINKSPVLAALRKGSVSMLAGLASGTVAYYLSGKDLAYGMMGTAAGVAVTVAGDIRTAPKVTDAQRAVLAHYVAVLR